MFRRVTPQSFLTTTRQPSQGSRQGLHGRGRARQARIEKFFLSLLKEKSKAHAEKARKVLRNRRKRTQNLRSRRKRPWPPAAVGGGSRKTRQRQGEVHNITPPPFRGEKGRNA